MSDTANELRKCLRFDKPTPEESRLEQLTREAADELDLLRELVQEAYDNADLGWDTNWNERAQKFLNSKEPS